MNFNDIRNCYIDKNIGIIGESEMKKFSVMIPIIEDSEGLKILFEVRAKTLRNQPGEISFPGGKIEENEEKLDAAIRETCEELGISEADVEVVGGEDILITQHNKVIYPYVGKILNPQNIKISVEEVDHVFYVPIKFFIQNQPIVKTVKIQTVPIEDFPFSDIENKVPYKLIEGRNSLYFYKYENNIIWGLTAKILNNFIKTIYEMEKKDDTYKGI